MVYALTTEDRECLQEKIVALSFQPYTQALVGAVSDFNRRISRAAPPFLLPETPVVAWLPRVGDRKIYQETFLAVENGNVRGAYTLKQQEFCFQGNLQTAAACQMPISEGIADQRYAFVGPRILRDAVRRQPMLFGLGIGSLDASITRLERAMGWRVQVIPFFFRVRNGFEFLRNIEYLKSTWLRRLMLDAAAYSGLGWAGAHLSDLLLRRRNSNAASLHVEEAGGFLPWADDVWDACRTRYSMTAVRDARVLDVLYPSSDPRFIRVRVRERGRTIGWAVLLDTRMTANKYFGNMRVGSIVDCLALPEDAWKVTSAATEVLDRRGVDLLLSNQSHPAWGRALRLAGFVQGTSNFIFTASKQISTVLGEIDPDGTGIHINRGDGDGPIHL